MNDDQIKEMISDIIKATDYDIWKSWFEEGCIEEPELVEDKVFELIDIAKGHLLFNG